MGGEAVWEKPPETAVVGDYALIFSMNRLFSHPTGLAMNITITDRAIDQIRTVASEEDVDLSSTMLRVAVVPGGCSGLTYDLGWDTTVQEQDTVEARDDVRVVLDQKSALYLDGTELDFTDGLQGDGFHFTNPQATRTCACGESFGM